MRSFSFAFMLSHFFAQCDKLRLFMIVKIWFFEELQGVVALKYFIFTESFVQISLNKLFTYTVIQTSLNNNVNGVTYIFTLKLVSILSRLFRILLWTAER